MIIYFIILLFLMLFPIFRQSRTELLLLKYTEGDDKNVLKLLKRDGRKEKDLCIRVLQYFVDKCTNKNEKETKSNNKINQSDSESDDDDDDDR